MRDTWNWWTEEGRRAALVAAGIDKGFASLLWEQLPPYVREAVEALP
jgi:hypothetical protein